MRKPNLSALSLKSLRDQIRAGTRVFVMQDDAAGKLHHMVWIPRFTVPRHILDEDCPSVDLELGGFAVDQYPCTRVVYQAEPELALAVSSPLVQPTTGLDIAAARDLAAARRFNGRPCVVMSPLEWGTLMWLQELLGCVGRPWSPYSWDEGIEPGWGGGLAFNGCGPSSSGHNWLPNGVDGLYGVIKHLLDAEMVGPLMLMPLCATLQGAIGSGDVDFAVQDAGASEKAFGGWPSENGVVRIGTESIRYAALVQDAEDPTVATLTQCTRGFHGAAAAHADGCQVTRMLYLCLVPGGGFWPVAWNALNNTDNPATVTLAGFVPAVPARSPQVGDSLCCESEDLLVSAIDAEGRLVLARGQNGTAIAAHPGEPGLGLYTRRYAQGWVHGQFGGRPTPETMARGGREFDVAQRYFVPAEMVDDVNAPGFEVQLALSAPGELVELLRGSNQLRGMECVDASLGAAGHAISGFRCVFRPNDVQYG